MALISNSTKTMKAVFFDRDGVITEPIFDLDRQVYRPPWKISEFKLMPFAIESLERFRNGGYFLFLITNQPDFAKGLISLKALKEIKYHLINILALNKIYFKEHYYCFHHPSQYRCLCRKPSPYFLFMASKDYHIILSESWMVGDMNKDILCGKRAGTKTIQICNGKSDANYKVNNIKEAVDIILNTEGK